MKQTILLLVLSIALADKTPIPYLLGYTTKDTIADAQTIEGWLGRPLDILGTTIALSGYWTPIPAPFAISAAVPMLTIPGWDPYDITDMNAAASGAYDQYYQNVANALARGGGTVYAVRLGWEMNGNWYPWSVNGTGGSNQTHQNYISTFRRMANIFRKTIPGINIEFCTNWAYYATSSYGTSGTPMDYWPGSEYVDIISMDIYQTDQGGDWNTALSGGFYNLNWLASYAKQNNVKIALSEWGAANDDASYINGAATWMNSLGNQFSYSVYSQYSPADQVVTPGENPNEQAAWVQQWGNTYHSSFGASFSSSFLLVALALSGLMLSI